MLVLLKCKIDFYQLGYAKNYALEKKICLGTTLSQRLGGGSFDLGQ